jgi:dipeptidyl aminopeptidase/acylaminoacyl peptidase
MRIVLRICSWAVIVACACATLAFADKRPITEKDFLKFKWVADPQISSDGLKVAFVLIEVNEQEDRYDSSLWLVEASGTTPPRRLTAGPRDSGPRWSPDGRTLAFQRAGEDDVAQTYLMPMSGGEGRRLTDLPKGTSAVTWSPDGKSVAFTSTTSQEDLDAKMRGGSPPKKSDVRIITRPDFRVDGGGWIDPSRPSHLWIASMDDGDAPVEAEQLTFGRFNEKATFWSRDGKGIYVVSNRLEDPEFHPPVAALYFVPLSGEPMQKKTDIGGMMANPACSPDGKSVAFTGFVPTGPSKMFYQPDLFVTEGGKVRNLTTEYDYDIGAEWMASDQHPPKGDISQPVVWSSDGKSLIVDATQHGRTWFVRVEVASGSVEPLEKGDHDIVSYSATPTGDRIACVLSDTLRVGDLFLFEPASGRFKQLTRFNDELFSHLEVAPPEEFWFNSFDRQRINGWVFKPVGFLATKKYPMILEIHGGPSIAYGHTMYHELLVLAARGYVVLFVNPRGSSSYGQAFADLIQYKYPGDDYRDLMAAVDEQLKRGFVDEKRLGVTGGSGGGILTNWTVTQTSRFAAAVSQRSIADMIGFWFTATGGIEDFFTQAWFRKFPFQDPEEYLSRSPVRFATNISTPMMFIEGDEDYVAPPGAGGEAMFRALKAQRKTAVMIRFPGEGHDLSRSGKPSHRIERLQHILNWFDKYLQGADIKLYDPQ